MTITVIRAEPISAIAYPVDGGQYDPAGWENAIHGTASDPDGGSVSQVRVSLRRLSDNKYWGGTAFDRTSEFFVTANGTANWAVSLPSSSLTNGTSYQVHTLATDNVGNVEPDGPWAIFRYGTPPLTVVNTMPAIAGGALLAKTTSIQVQFSDCVAGGGTSDNYELRGIGPDGLLGTDDDVIVPISVSYSGMIATLAFAPLSESVYRLTIKDGIADLFHRPLDGDGDGTDGGVWIHDFVVNEMPAGLDPSFDGDGKLTTDFGATEKCYSVAVQRDGKIVVAGWSNNGSKSNVALARYNPDGSLDTSFDGDGKVTTAIGTSFDYGQGLAVQADGRIVVAGYSRNGTTYDFAVVRYNTDGSLDASFDFDGKTTTAIGPGEDTSWSIALQPNGKIVAAGRAYNGSDYDLAVVRYDTYGRLDTTFGGTGKVTTAIGASYNELGYSVAIQPDGKILVTGCSNHNSQNNDFAIVRYNADGSLDTTFDGDGKLTTDFSASGDYGQSVAVQPDGKIVVAGYSVTDFAVARYNMDGTLDTSFDGDGKLTTNLGGSYDYGHSVAVQSDGKIVVAGEFQDPNKATVYFTVVRYNSDGSLDTTFDGDGKLATNFASSTMDYAESVVMQSDGRIVVAGYASTAFAVARLGVGTIDLRSAHAFPFDIDGVNWEAGQMISAAGTANGLNRLQVNGTDYAPTASYALDDGGRTVLTGAATLSGLTVHREIAVPNVGNEDFARYVDVFENPTISPITTTVRIVGNLGSDTATTVFQTSDGDATIEPTDQWIGTDDADGTGSPAVIHYIHGPSGLQPTSVIRTGDNIEWTYTLTVPAGQTVRLASLTILNASRAGAVAAADALVSSSGFGGQAAAFLTDPEQQSLVNFGFIDSTPPNATSFVPADDATSVGLNANLVATFSENIQKGTATDIVIKRSSDGATIETISATSPQVTVSGNQATIDPSVTFAENTGYYVLIDAGAFTDLANNTYPGIGDATTWNFTTGDLTPPTVVSTTPSLAGGALPAGATSLQVLFSENVSGGATVANYQLQSLGADGLLGTGDDAIIPVSASCVGTTATLSFVGLSEGVYRLTVKDSITDPTGNALDGDANGAAGGDWSRDFVVSRMPTVLDSSFDGDGKLTTSFGAGDDYGRSVAIAPDGKIVVVGNSWNGRDFDVAVARYNVDGSLDASFDGDGKLTTAIGTTYDGGFSVVVRPDGKIVVAGSLWNGNNSDFAIVRYNIDGSLDATFDGDGYLTTDFDASDDSGASVALEADGKIVVAGYSRSAGGYDFAVARYDADGSLDTTFDGDGKLTVDVAGGNDLGTSVALEPDGKLLVAGYAYLGGKNHFAVVRCNADGSLDTSFDGDGKLTTGFGASSGLGQSMAIQSDGKIVVAGWSNNDVALVRYNINGTLDASFDGDGKLTTDFLASPDYANSVAIGPDGKIVVAGMSRSGGNYDFAVLRYNADGSLDATLDGDGRMTTAIGASDDYSYSMAIAPDGKIVVAGYASNGSNMDFAVARYGTGAVDLRSSHSLSFDVDTSDWGAGQLIGAAGAAEGLNRLQVGGVDYAPTAGYTLDDGGRTVVTGAATLFGLNVHREITVPNTGNEDFARTVDVFENPTASAIMATVRIVGNLGSDAATAIFSTSDGDTIIEPTDQWIGTDDADGSGTPAVIHYIHGPNGLKPTAVTRTGDNIEWTYTLTVAPGQTLRLASFTIVSATQAGAIAAANALVTPTTFGGQAAAFLTDAELESLGNFVEWIPPSVVSLSPAVNASNVGLDASLAMTFSEAIQKGTSGSILIKRTSDGATIETISVASSQVTVSGNQAAIALSMALAESTGYYVQIDSGAFQDLVGNAFVGISDPAAWSFVTGDFTAPTISTLSPVDNAVGVTLTANLVLSFSENIQKGTAGSIVIKTVNDDSTVETISVASPQVVVLGNQVTIDPTVSFAEQTDYYVQIAGGAFEDLAGLSCAGINDATAWNFTTGDFTAPTVTSATPALSGGVLSAGTTSLQVLFSETVAGAANGDNYSLRSLGPDSLLGTDDDATIPMTVSYSGTTVTLTFAALSESVYRLTVKDAIADVSGNRLHGDANGASGGDWVRDFVANLTAGALDPSFDGDGKVVSTVQLYNMYAQTGQGVAVQSNGKIVVAGFAYNGSNNDFAVMRYNADGSLDTSFDGDGKVTTSIGSADDYGQSVAIQSDGKIVVAGYSSNGSNNDFAVVRYNANGSLDTSFDGDGRVTTSIGSADDYGQSVAIQSDGKIVVAGYSTIGSNNDFAVVRYNANGTLDTSFDGDGKLTTSIGTANDYGQSVVVQTDGKIVVAGSSFVSGGNSDFAVVRYNANGSLDASFDGDGKLATDIDTSDNEASSVALQSDGKIVVAGVASKALNDDFAVVRYNANGSLDTSFDGDGKLTTDMGAPLDFAASVAIQTDGKIVAAGCSGYSVASLETSLFTAVRYNADGSLDTSFDGDGKLTTAVGTSDTGGSGVALQSDGKIVVAGYSSSCFALVRYNPEGSLDTSFDGDGKLTTAIGSSYGSAYSVAVQSDGKIVVAGSSDNGNNYDFAVVRYNPDGTFDTSFAGDGKVTTDIDASSDGPHGVAIQSDGKIVAAGTSWKGNSYGFAIVRYNSNGSLDSTFDGDGKATTTFGAGYVLSGGMSLQSDGKIVVAGSTYNGSDYDFALARYNTDGSLDTSFHGNGKVTTAVGASNDYGSSVAVQPDGKIVVAGYSYIGAYTDFAVVRYNPDGSLDTSFDGDGKLTTSISSSHDVGASVALQSDGRIVVAGESVNSDYDIAVVRYNANGSLDTSFDGDGTVTTAVGTSSDDGYSVYVQPDGKIVVAGLSYSVSHTDFALVRYNANGSLDTSFDSDGKVTTQVGTSSSFGYGMALQPDGNIVMVGKAGTETGFAFAVARYYGTGSADLLSSHGRLFDVDTSNWGTGQLLSAAGAANGLNRLQFDGTDFTPSSSYSLDDGGRTVVTGAATFSGLNVHREITVPAAGDEDFARYVDVFENATASPITTTVRIVGNLASDAATTVFATSDGNATIEPTDQWIGTDDADGTGSPAIIHYIHGPNGLKPTSVIRTGDNIEWSYNLSLAPGQTVRLASFTILGATRADALAAAEALVTSGGFGGQAAAFLTDPELQSLANFTDALPPSATVFAPADNATGVATNANLAITFNKNIQAGTGRIVIRNAFDDSVIETISVPSARVTVYGNRATIDPSASLAENTAYYIQIDAGTFTDLSNHPSLEIVDKTTWNFTTGDFTAPTATVFSPADNATGVTLNGNLAISFSEPIQKGASGDIVVKRTSDNYAVETIPVASGQVTISGTQATIDPSITFAESTGYYVQITSGVFTDLAGLPYAGISTTTAWNFTTGDFTPPTVSALSPTDNATGVGVNANLILWFSETIQKGTSGNILIKRTSDDSTIETIAVTNSRVTVSGNQATIDPATTFAEKAEYYVQIPAGTFNDFSGLSYAGISDTTTWNFTTGDFTAPTVSTLSPADNATGVTLAGNLVISFSEPIQKGASGDIVIKRTNDNVVVETIPISSGQVTIAGSQATIARSVALAESSGYYVQIPSGTFTDLAGLAYAGISTTTTWNFTTGDFTPPTITSFSPADNATGVGVNANLVLSFSEAIQKGTSGNIVITRASDNATVEAIAVTDSRVTVSGSQVTIDPATTFTEKTDYHVQIPAGAFKDLSGLSYAGISDATTWNFTTGDFTAPTVSTLAPADNSTGVTLNANLVLSFSEPMQKGASGDIVIQRTSDNVVVETISVTSGQVTVSGTQAKIDPTVILAESTGYYVQIPGGALTDLAGLPYAGFSTTTGWNFTTGDFTPPAVTSVSPADNVTGVAVDGTLVLWFNEAVQKGAAGSVILKDSVNNSVVEAIPVASSEIGFAGTQVWIKPSVILAESTGYYVQIASATFVDLSGNAYAGISDPTTWNFTTGDFTPPIMTAFSPADNAVGAALDANLVITFSEPVQKIGGTIVIKKAGDDSVVDTIPVSSSAVTVSGNQVTIDPWATLNKSTAYYVQVPGSAFADFTYHGSAGISDKTTWNFSTGDVAAPTMRIAASADGYAGNSSPGGAFTAIHTTEETPWIWNNSSGECRGLIDFDISEISPNVTIVSAALHISFDVISFPPPRYPVVDIYGYADDGNLSPSDASTQATHLGAVRVTDVMTEDISFDPTFIQSVLGLTTYVGLRTQILSNEEGFNAIFFSTEASRYTPSCRPTLILETAVDTHAPVVKAISPIDKSAGVGLNASLVMAFNENIRKGTAGNIVIKRGVDDSVVETLPVASPQVVVAGNQATIAPSASFTNGMSYYVQIDGGAFEDMSGNAYAGIGDSTTWTFTTAAPVAFFSEKMDVDPGWTTSGQWAFGHPTGQTATSYGHADPVNGQTGINVYGVNLNGDYSTTVGGPYYLTTNAIDCSLYTGATLRFQRWLNTDYQPYVADTVDVSRDGGATWTSVYQNSASVKSTDSSWQLLQYDLSAVADHQPNVTIRWGYQVAPGAYFYSGWNIDDVVVLGVRPFLAPLTSVSPADDATRVPLDAQLVLNFYAAIHKGTGGNIVIKRSNDNAVVETIPVTDGRVTVSGNQVTIDPSVVFAEKTGYYVEIDGGAFLDLAGNPFPGISDATTWNFTTIDLTPPTLASITPSLSGGVLLSGATSLQVLFSEDVAGSATPASDYALQSLGPDALLGTADDALIPVSVVYSGATATLTFAPLPESVYRLTLKDSITDLAGNKLDGDANGSAGGLWSRDFVANRMPSALDASFSGDGQEITNFGPDFGWANSVAVQPDGKIVATGFWYRDSTTLHDLAVVRYNVDGSVDTSFDGDGVVITALSAASDYGQSVAIQRDGKIVVAGTGNDYEYFVVMRYNANGSLDTSFDGDGKVTTDISTAGDCGYSMAVQPDGKIVVAGVATDPMQGGRFAVLRYNPDGSLDASFGNSGKVITDCGNARSVAIQPDGKIVVAGLFGGTTEIVVARYNSDGTLDDSFDEDGKLFTRVSPGNDSGNGVTLQPDGKILVAGGAGGGDHASFAVLRYNPDGSLDTGFSGDGIVTTALSAGNDCGNSVALQPDGKIVVAGVADYTVNGGFAVVRYNSDGSLDSTFNGSGSLVLPFGSTLDEAKGVVVSPDGKVIVAGNGDWLFGVVRLGTGSADLLSSHGLLFDVDTGDWGAGQLLSAAGAANGLGRLQVGGTDFVPTASYTSDDGGRTVLTGAVTLAGLNVRREITVPNAGNEDFARSVDVFENPTTNPITTTVRIVGNLSSDAATAVFQTSDGDTAIETTDQWIGADDADGTGSPAVIHYIHGPNGLQPTSVVRTGDNIEWTYSLTVAPGQTTRLASFTILSASRADAVAAASALVTSSGFGGQATTFLTDAELQSLANFVEGIPPSLTSLSPADNAVGVGVNANLVLSFSEPIQKGTSGNIIINRASDNVAVETIPVTDARVTIAGTQATINPTMTFAETTGYYATVDGGAFKDLAGNAYGGISGTSTWNFTTGDFTAPTATTLSPANNATGVARRANLIITFNENIQKGTSGSIVIKRSSNNSTIETISVTGSQVTISGNQATINPSNTLSSSTSYYVLIDNGAFKDLSNNPYAGISSTTAWKFTTGTSMTLMENVNFVTNDIENSSTAIAFSDPSSGSTADNLTASGVAVAELFTDPSQGDAASLRVLEPASTASRHALTVPARHTTGNRVGMESSDDGGVKSYGHRRRPAAKSRALSAAAIDRLLADDAASLFSETAYPFS